MTDLTKLTDEELVKKFALICNEPLIISAKNFTPAYNELMCRLSLHKWLPWDETKVLLKWKGDLLTHYDGGKHLVWDQMIWLNYRDAVRDGIKCVVPTHYMLIDPPEAPHDN